jgi:hypothetical protein
MWFERSLNFIKAKNLLLVKNLFSYMIIYSDKITLINCWKSISAVDDAHF